MLDAVLKQSSAILLALAFGSSPVLAQELGLVPGTQLPAAGQKMPATVQSAVLAPATITHLVPFEQSQNGMRLSGEDDTNRLSFHLSAADAARGGAIRIAYQNAVSVHPDISTVDAELNGAAIGSFPIRSPNGHALQDLQLPANLLVAGRNTLRLRARQHHRVDCSVEAVYELWTQLDPLQSGFVAEGEAGYSSLADLLAIARDTDAATEIRLIAPEDDRAAMVRDSLQAIQTLALYLNRPDLRLSVASTPGTGPGVDVYFGDAGWHAQTAQARKMLEQAPGGLSVSAAAEPGRANFILRGANKDQVTAALLSAVNGPMRADLDMGVLAPRPDTLVAGPAARFILQDADYRSAPFFGRLSKMSFNIEMPADFYPGDYGTVNVYLNAATAPGLAPGAQLLFRVNDRAASSYRFYDTKGEAYMGKRIELPLRSFRSGLNRVDILAELPTPADKACDFVSGQDTTPRFLLLDTTAVEIPPLARMGRMPDLAAFASTGYPFGDGATFDVAVDQADEAFLGSAMTLVARLSLAARKPLNANLVVGGPDMTAGRNTLVLTTHDAAGLAMSARPADAKAAVMDPARIDPFTTSAIGMVPALGAQASRSNALLDSFQVSTAVEDDRASWSGRLSRWAAASLPAMGDWLTYRGPKGAADLVDASDVQLRMTQIKAPIGNGTWTVFGASTSDELQAGVLALTEPAAWSALDGGMAVVRKSDGAVLTAMPASLSYAPISDTSFSNLRRLAAAWLSENYAVYVGLVVFLLGGFGLWLGYAVPRQGVRTDK